MDLLLYFGSYAAVVTLFASGVIAALWVLVKALRSAAGFARVLINPEVEEDITRRVPPDHQLHQLKRAGQ